jgi:hypothetical protein
MMKRLRLIFLLLFVLLAGMLTFSRFHNREPSYQGRSLTQWLEEFNKTFDDPMSDGAVLNASTNAVKQIGTNAIPFLLKKITARDGAFEKRIQSLLRKQSMIHFHFKNGNEEMILAFQGFVLLGKDAKSAIPALVALTKDPDVMNRCRALGSLAAIGPDKQILMPILLRLLHDQDRKARLASSTILAEVYPEEAEKAGVYTNFPFLKPASSNIVPTNAPAIQ